MTIIGCLSLRRTRFLTRQGCACCMHIDLITLSVGYVSCKKACFKDPRIKSLLIELHARGRCLDLLPGLRCSSATCLVLTSSKQHTAHHVHQGVSLAGNLDGEVLLANLSQSIVPNTNFSNLYCIVCGELSEEIGTSALDSQQQHGEEVHQREGREHPGVGAGTTDILHPELRIGCCKPRSENKQGFIRAADISSEEVWEDCA